MKATRPDAAIRSSGFPKKALGLRRKSNTSSTLLLVLFFILLITTLVVAFLSNATLERQLAGASTSQNKTDLVAQGAIATTIADLQEEIKAGSSGSGAPSLANGYYYPTSNSTAVPYPVLGGISHATPPTVDGLENLVKISYRGTAFYSGTAYNTTSYPAPNRAPSAAAAVCTTNVSYNNRSVTTVRWNAPLLLTRANASLTSPTTAQNADYTPVSNFVPPDWIYVARDGSNPTNWNSEYIYKPGMSLTNAATAGTPGTDPVMQRYAYAIYNEGGTLDMNVAGSPSYNTASLTYSTNCAPYKNALTYADLTQLPYLSTNSVTVATGTSGTISSVANQIKLINAIVGWRNNSSAHVSGSFPNYTTFPTTISNAYKTSLNIAYSGYPLDYFALNANGFLNIGGLKLQQQTLNANAVLSNQSDNLFTSRQQLIQFFTQGLGQNSTMTNAISPANLENVLQYLGTFSRDISQPSYAPPVSFSSSGVPTIQSGTGGNSAYGGDSTINPALLGTTIPTGATWMRNNGTTVVPGEPLVKKRFALMRLAWLTYNGPSANRTIPTSNPGAGTANYDMWQLVNTYGIPASFLAQGTAQNIYEYFGLSWVSDPNNSGSSEWVYTHGDGASSYTSSTNTPSSARIKTFTDLIALTNGREPDFFELLKAGLCVGSLGKAYTASHSSYSSTVAGSPADYYGQRDQDVDNQIIQIGANIISQYQPSGYPARILFNDGCLSSTFSTSIIEHRGVVDLPYIYGMREGKIRTVDSTPAAYNYANLPVAGSALTGNGTAVALQEPEIWNPHAWTSTSDNSDGNPRPTKFRIYAETCDPTYDATGNSPSAAHAISLTVGIRLNNSGGVSSSDDSTATPSTPTTAASWKAANTAMTFSIPQSTTAANDYNYLFREPTLLCVPSIPSNSSLAIDTTTSGAASTIKALFSTTSIPSLDASGHYPSTSTLATNKSFIGFVLGNTKLPLAWKEKITVVGGVDGTNPTTVPTTYTVPANYTSLSSGDYATYRLQYQDSAGNWITYDEKYAPIVRASRYNPWGTSDTTWGSSEQRWFNSEAIGDELFCFAVDPRTGRFGGMNVAGRNGNGNRGGDWPIGVVWSSGVGWAAPVGSSTTATANASNQNALWTARPDENQGFLFSLYDPGDYNNYYGVSTGPVAAGWYPPAASHAQANFGVNGSGYSGQLISPGLVCQNNMAIYSTANSTEFSGTSSISGPTGYGLGCFADPDGVVRRGMAAYVPPTASLPASQAAANASTAAASGLPLKTAYTFSSAASSALTAGAELASRPIMLNRPFSSVADLGHVFSDTPWRNLDFSTPESGNPGFLDIFCINDTNDPNGLAAGKVDLNTRQAPVLQAILSGAYKDLFSATYGTGTVPVLPGISATTTQATASVIAKGLVSRTSGGYNLVNIGDLVGKWSSSVTNSYGTTPNNIDGSQSYTGFSGTSATNSAPASSPENLSDLLYKDFNANGTVAAYDTNNVNRMREVAIRALANCGTTRVWNLMLDVIAQTGRFPSSASSLANFNVEGERRYWVHVALDRYTGKVLDEQIEEVKE